MSTREPQSPNDGKQADDAWLDEALAQSFPASDPVPHFHGDAAPIEGPDDSVPQA